MKLTIKWVCDDCGNEYDDYTEICSCGKCVIEYYLCPFCCKWEEVDKGFCCDELLVDSVTPVCIALKVLKLLAWRKVWKGKQNEAII